MNEARNKSEFNTLPEFLEIDLSSLGFPPQVGKRAGERPIPEEMPVEIKLDFKKLMEDADDAMKCVSLVPLPPQKGRRKKKGD